jgi:hypothetical protein
LTRARWRVWVIDIEVGIDVLVDLLAHLAHAFAARRGFSGGALGPRFRGVLVPEFWGASPLPAPTAFAPSAWSWKTTTKHSHARS